VAGELVVAGRGSHTAMVPDPARARAGRRQGLG
jgi:hypothetical protein